MANLAATVGGGSIGPGPASIVSTAAIQLGASRYLSDLGARLGDAKLLLDGSRLADASRQNLLAAHELVAKEAKSRPKSTKPAWMAIAEQAAADGARQRRATEQHDTGAKDAPAGDVVQANDMVNGPTKGNS
jgi:hypothetical protein